MTGVCGRCRGGERCPEVFDGVLKESCHYDYRDVKRGIKFKEVFIKRMGMRGFD
jgi:hypothetical protein